MGRFIDVWDQKVSKKLPDICLPEYYRFNNQPNKPIHVHDGFNTVLL